MARWYWHIHHDRLLERATEPISVRKAYIREMKPSEEVPLRLRLLRPATLPLAVQKDVGCGGLFCATAKTRRLVYRLHRKQCVKNCPWNGHDIFRRSRRRKNGNYY